MFHRRTLFVLGAGASAEADMPIGTRLADLIRKKANLLVDEDRPVSGDHELYRQVVNATSYPDDRLLRAAWLIRDGITLSQSIDDFLDQHRDNEDVTLFGKAAIVRTILERERSCKLALERDAYGREFFHSEKLADTWYLKFMYMLGRGIAKSDVRRIFDNVSFIIFNYDRCVEHFLCHGLQNLYGIREGEASDILSDLDIIHPLGQVGDYLKGSVPFGATSVNYFLLARDIKTYTEQLTSLGLMKQIQAEFHRAKCIVFVGFGYHSQNMRLIKPSVKLKAKPVFGTANGMSDSDRNVVLHQIADLFDSMTEAEREAKLKLENKLTAAGLFDEYAKSLTGGD